MKYCIIGGGAFGTSLAINIAKKNVKILLYVREKKLYIKNKKIYLSDDFSKKEIDSCDEKDGSILYSEYIKKYRRNNSTLPNITLPDNIKVTGIYDDIFECENIIWSIPNDALFSAVNYFTTYLNTYEKTNGTIKRNNRTFLTTVKGIISDNKIIYASKILENLNISTGILSGANIAREIATGVISESILVGDEKIQQVYSDIFSLSLSTYSGNDYMKIVELFGAMKNIVAILVGIVDGLAGKYNIGENTTACVFQRGISEMMSIIEFFNGNIKKKRIYTILLSSAGLGDLFVTCRCGRNYKEGIRIGKLYGRGSLFYCSLNEESGRICKLQGISTVKSIYELMGSSLKNYKLFYILYLILHENAKIDILIEILNN